MDNCPKCNNLPITFGEWCKGTNAFSHTCKSCLCGLKGQRKNLIGLILTVVVAVGALIVAHTVFGFTFERRGIMFFAVLIPPVYLGAWIGYFYGGYTLVAKPKEEDV